MKRDLETLAHEKFDVLVIGGGIHGTAIVRELALAGLKVALIEQGDFCQGTSFNSLKIIHGGFRYLQNLDMKRIRESVRSRRELMRFAPHLVHPQGFIVPTYGHGLRGKEVMRVALSLYDLISCDRNLGLGGVDRIPAGKVLSKSECERTFPHLEKHRLSGAALWYDALALNTERLALAFLSEASECGACVANYVKATEILVDQDRVEGARVEDRMTGQRFDIRAKTLVMAAGPWSEDLLPQTESKKQGACGYEAKAFNIVVRKSFFGKFAVGLEGNQSFDKRSPFGQGKGYYFFVPWRGYTMIGTAYKPHLGYPEQVTLQSEDMDELIREVNRIYPAADLTLDDVTFFHVGLLPATFGGHRRQIQLEKKSTVLDSGTRTGIRGLISVRPSKYTAAPEVASRVRDLVSKRRQGSLPGKGNEASHKLRNASSGPEMGPHARAIRHLQSVYGYNYLDVFKRVSDKKELAEFVSTVPPLSIGEVRYAVREEMALKLSDIVFRRSDLGTAECPPKGVLERVAGILSEELAWDQSRKSGEIQEVLDYYSPLKGAQKAERASSASQGVTS